MIGSNTVIFNLTEMNDDNIKKYEEFFKESNQRLDEIKEKEYDQLTSAFNTIDIFSPKLTKFIYKLF